MKRAIPLILGAGLCFPARAEEAEGPEFAPSFELVAGVAPDALPLTTRSSLAADLHGTVGMTLQGTPLLDGGANLGLSIKNWEIKPLGAHLHCHDGEPCEPAYSFESYGIINPDFAFGFGFALGSEGISELRAPLGIRGFALTPSLHHEEGEWHPALQVTAIWKIDTQVSLGPSCQFSEELVNCGVSLWLGHAHPH